MRACQLVVVLLVVCLSSASALRCNRCILPPAGRQCTDTVETCNQTDEVCASVVITFPNLNTYLKRCMKPADALILKANGPSFQVSTCSTDLCN